MSKQKKIVYPDELFIAISECDDGPASDASDGAWFAMLENTVTFYNDAHGTNFNENDAVHAWCAWQERQQKEKVKARG